MKTQTGTHLNPSGTLEITERQRAEGLLRQSKERLHHLVSANPSVIYSLKFQNGELVPTWISDNIVQLTGHTPEEVLVPNWWADRLHPDDRERRPSLPKRALVQRPYGCRAT